MLHRDEALLAAAESIRRGQIVAVKGIGGFHLMVAAGNSAGVRRLREQKHRDEKPLAVMFPSLESVKAVCEVSPLEARLLTSPESPIVLLKRHNGDEPGICDEVAPGNPSLGVMLPYTPLHHLLLAELQLPVVATSGNLGDEPICTDERDAVDRLFGIADVFLVHNRPIIRHVDDSIVRVVLDREMVLRRARGFAPLPITLKSGTPETEVVLAVGAHLKNTVALSVGPQVFISQHIGDLETDRAYGAFRKVIDDFRRLYEVEPTILVTDAHPDYLSTQFALAMAQARPSRAQSATAGLPCREVQHHIAHVLSCLAENEAAAPALGVAWDGTGLGSDGTIWGGEFFLVTERAIERAAHFRTFRLPGGEKAIKEPRRSAIGLLYEFLGEAALAGTEFPCVLEFSPGELAALKTMLSRGINSPRTSSAGRLFDAVAALARVRQHNRYEGQAAMELEFLLDGCDTDESYSINFQEQLPGGGGPIVLDWAPMIEAIIADVQNGVKANLISARFHNALAGVILAVANRIGQPKVALSGGCFQNRQLTERTVRRLRAGGFQPYWHQRVPANDGGISLGQVVAALREKGQN